MVNDLKDKLLKAQNDSVLFEVIQDLFYDEQNTEGQLSAALVELHHQGHINLLDTYLKLPQKEKEQNYYPIIQTFQDAIPHLKVEVLELVECINHLMKETVQDGTAHSLLLPLKKFCSIEITRAQALFDFVLENPHFESDMLSIALEAGATRNESLFFNHAICLLQHDQEEVCQRAIQAIGNINYKDKNLIELAVDAVDTLLEKHHSDFILASSLRTLVRLSAQTDKLEHALINFIDGHINHHGEQYIYEASVTLFIEHKQITPSIESRLLDICSYANPQSTQTINNIDHALRRILKQDNLQICVNFIEKFFEHSDFKLSVKAFSSFVRELHNHKDTYLATLITRWMLAKKLALGQFCFDLIQSVHGDCSLTYDIKLVPTNVGACSFLAKKACGWFFVHPKTVMSLIESLISVANETELAEIQRIVFNPLLISYPGSVKDYLSNLKQSSDQKLSVFAASVLSEFSDYRSSIDAALQVKELRPSESDQYIYWTHHQKVMDESMKQARQKSFLSSLFGDNESVLLYGNKSIHYVYRREGKTRQEMPLQQIKHSFELASMQNIDPYGLDDRLWHFRVEGCTS